jgi:hypothetical protein
VDSRHFRQPEEARQILAAKVEELRGLGYDELKRRCGTVKHELFEGRLQILEGGNPNEEIEVTGPSGVVYFMEIDVEDPFGPVEVSVNLGEKYGSSPEIGGGFEIQPPTDRD